jgi:hypothetical protein
MNEDLRTRPLKMGDSVVVIADAKDPARNRTQATVVQVGGCLDCWKSKRDETRCVQVKLNGTHKLLRVSRDRLLGPVRL